MSPRLEIASRLLASRNVINPGQFGLILELADALLEADVLFEYIKNGTPLCDTNKKAARDFGFTRFNPSPLVPTKAEPPKPDPVGRRWSTAMCVVCGIESTWPECPDLTRIIRCSNCSRETKHHLTPDPL